MGSSKPMGWLALNTTLLLPQCCVVITTRAQQLTTVHISCSYSPLWSAGASLLELLICFLLSKWLLGAAFQLLHCRIECLHFSRSCKCFPVLRHPPSKPVPQILGFGDGSTPLLVSLSVIAAHVTQRWSKQLQNLLGS